MPREVIIDKYCISESTLKRITKLFESGQYWEEKEHNKLGAKIFKYRDVKKVAASYVYLQETPFRAKDVWSHVRDCLGARIDPRTMRKFLKKELSMSFKRASSRPSSLDMQRQHRLKMLFALIITKRFERCSCILNIDESSFSRLTKTDYTWLKRGVSGTVKNIKYSGSLSLVTAISTTGHSYSAATHKTIDSDMFIIILKKLISDVVVVEHVERSKILLMLDNAPCHQAKRVIDYLDESKIQYAFLPQ